MQTHIQKQMHRTKTTSKQKKGTEKKTNQIKD